MSDRAVETAFKEQRGRTVVVFEKQRFAEGELKVDVVAGIEVGHAHGAKGRASRREIRRIGALAIALEVSQRQHDRRGIHGGGRLLGHEGGLDGGAKLPLIKQRPRPREIGPCRQHRCGGKEDGKRHR